MPKRKKDQTSKGPTLDVEATRQHYNELDRHIKEAEAGGARIKPKSLYAHLVAERDRLGELLNHIDNKCYTPTRKDRTSVLSFFLDCRHNNQQTKTDRFTERSAIKKHRNILWRYRRQLIS